MILQGAKVKGYYALLPPLCTFVILPIDITPLQNDIKSLLVARLHWVEQQVVFFQTLILTQGNDRKQGKQKDSRKMGEK